MNKVQIIDNMYLRPKKDGRFFPTLTAEVVAHDMISNSSWYELSDEAFEEWQLCCEMWKSEKEEDYENVRAIRHKQLELHGEEVEVIKLGDCLYEQEFDGVNIITNIYVKQSRR